MKRYDRVVGAFYAEYWAVDEDKFDQLVAFFELKAAGLSRSEEEIAHIAGRVGEKRGLSTQSRSGTVAVLPLFGLIAERMNMVTAVSGGTAVDEFSRSMQTLVDDPGVSAIVLDVDSPGGSVSGMNELAAKMREYRRQKPVVAVANPLMGSAAYWIASSASEVVVRPSSMVGSIGVMSAHVDESKKNEQEGRRVTIFRSGPNKATDTSAEPLSDAAKAERQGFIDHFAGLFRADVAKGRRVPVATVQSQFGEGRMFNAKDAVRLGMADREVASIDEVIVGLLTGETNAAALLEKPEIAAEVSQICDIQAATDAETAPIAAEQPELASEETAEVRRRRLQLRSLELG